VPAAIKSNNKPKKKEKSDLGRKQDDILSFKTKPMFLIETPGNCPTSN